jgi:hypothetical protein
MAATITVKREQEASIESKGAFKTSQKYPVTYQVLYEDSDPIPVPSQVLREPQLPKVNVSIYSPRPGKLIPFCYCRRKSVKCDGKNLRLWTVTTEFSTDGETEQEEKNDTEDPLSLAPRIEPFVESMDSIDRQEDIDGKKLQNPLGELWSDPIVFPTPLAGVRVTRYVSGYDESVLASWLWATNSSPWRGKPEDAWRIRSVVGAKVNWNGTEIGELTFEIVEHPLEYDGKRVGWFGARQLRGSRYKDGTETKIFKDKGVIVEKFLNEDGTENTTGDPKYLFYRTSLQKDFTLIA